MKNKSTKHALLASVLSIVMCFAMLIGSTFAWFTDEVKSGMNKIVAGNLDVELEYSLDGTTWTAVDENTNMFKEDALWEPGYTEVVYLRVSNVGSLALKYQFGINVADKVIGKTADDRDIDLSNFIEFGVVEAEAVFADRAAARAAVNGNTALISAGYSSTEGHLIAGDKSNMLALVVYMPETVDNAANYAGDNQPSINLGIKLVATQDAVENDSFGNDYDKDALLNFVQVSNADELIAALEGNSTILLTNEVSLSNALNVTNATINGNGNTITGGQMGTNARIINLTGLNEDVSLVLNGVHMVGETAQFNSKGISAYDANNISLNISGSTVEAKAYAIRIGTGVTDTVNVNIKDSELKGWAGFVTFGKTNAVFDNVTFTGTNYDLSGNENGYDIVELHNGSQGSNIVFKNCIFNLTKSGDAIYGFLGVQYSGNESYSVVTYENCKFILDGRELTFDEVITAENMDYTGATVTIDGRVINP